MSIDATGNRFELVKFHEKDALFTYRRIDPCTVPDGVYHYEIQRGDYRVLFLIRRHVDAGFSGSILISTPLEADEPGLLINGSLIFMGRKTTLAGYVKRQRKQAKSSVPQMGGQSL